MCCPNEGEVEEKESSWKDLDKVVDRVGNGYRLCVLGDLNGWFGDRLRAGMIGGFRVPGGNDNSGRMIDFCPERGYL